MLFAQVNISLKEPKRNFLQIWVDLNLFALNALADPILQAFPFHQLSVSNALFNSNLLTIVSSRFSRIDLFRQCLG